MKRPINPASIRAPFAAATSVFAPGGGGQTRADGRFTIGEVTPGSYHLSASVPIMVGGRGSGGGAWVSTDSGGAFGTFGVAGGTARAVTGGVERPIDVTVTDADVSGVRVVVRRPDRP